jgi:hypothetical protein
MLFHGQRRFWMCVPAIFPQTAVGRQALFGSIKNGQDLHDVLEFPLRFGSIEPLTAEGLKDAVSDDATLWNLA